MVRKAWETTNELPAAKVGTVEEMLEAAALENEVAVMMGIMDADPIDMEHDDV